MSPPTKPPPEDLSHFLTIPWCAALLTAPTTTLLPSLSRIPKSSTEDSLFAETLKTPTTIAHMVSFSSPAPPTAATGEQINTLLALSSGINGYPNVAHGGLTATLIDEGMGVCMMRQRAAAGKEIVTARLEVTYLRPLRTPGTALVSVWIGEQKGRKWVLMAELRDGDGEGGVVARGEAMWVEVRANM